MKTRAKILGIVSALIIVLCVYLKVNHLAGAGILMILSLSVLLPIYLIVNISGFIKDFKLNILVLLLGIFFLVYVIGLLFITMHWPNGGLIFGFGFLLTLFTLIIMYFKGIGNTANNFSTFFITLSIFIISLIYIASFRGVARNIIDGFLQSKESVTTTKNILYEYNKELITNNDSSNNSNNIHQNTIELLEYIDQIKDKLEKTVDGDLSNSNYDFTDYVMFVQGNAKQLKLRINTYQDSLISLNSNQSNDKIYKLLNTLDPPMREGLTNTWESGKFEHLPVVSAITTLTNIQVNILMAEKIILESNKK